MPKTSAIRLAITSAPMKYQVSSLFNTLSICTYDMRKPIQFIQFMLTRLYGKHNISTLRSTLIQNDVQAIIYMLTQWIHVCFYVLEVFDWVNKFPHLVTK